MTFKAGDRVAYAPEFLAAAGAMVSGRWVCFISDAERQWTAVGTAGAYTQVDEGGDAPRSILTTNLIKVGEVQAKGTK